MSACSKASLDPDWRRYVSWVIAHETAHFWFGHLVDGRDPEDLWLTEGIATYLCHRLMEELAPELNAWATFHVLEASAAHEADSSTRTHAITQPPSAIRSGIPALTYVKPAAVMRQLEAIIGRARLDAALTTFLQQHPFMDATTADFVRCLEGAASVDLNGWADDWLRSEGVNTLEVEMTATDGRLTACRILQSPAGGRLRTHRITVSVYDKTSRGLIRRDPIPVSISGASTPVPELLGHPRPDIVVLNAPATGYVKVRLDPRTRETVANYLGELDAETRAVCWVAGWEMVKDGIMPAAELAHWVVEHAGKERDPQVRELLQATCHPPLPAWYEGSLQALTSSKD